MKTALEHFVILFISLFTLMPGQIKKQTDRKFDAEQPIVTFDSVKGYYCYSTDYRSSTNEKNNLPLFDPRRFEQGVNVRKKIYKEHQRAEQLYHAQQRAEKEAALRKVAEPPQLERATLFGKPTRFYKVPSIPQAKNSFPFNRSAIANVLINGKENDTITAGDIFTLSFSFAPGYISAVMNVYLDVDHNGMKSADDYLLSENILFLDNSDDDEDQAVGLYKTSFSRGENYGGFITTMIFEMNDYQSVSSATLTVQQKTETAVILGSTDPPFPNIVIQVEKHSGDDIYLGTDSSGKFSVSINRSETQTIELYLYDLLGVSNGYILQSEIGKEFPITGDTTVVELKYLPATSFVEGFVHDQTDAGIQHSGILTWINSLLFIRTDSNGYYKIGVTPDKYGKVELEWNMFETNEYLYNWNNDDDVTVVPNSTVRKDFIHAKANGTISGKITFGGKGIGGVPVAILSDSLRNVALSLEDGTYSVPAYKPAIGDELYSVHVPVLGESYSSTRGYYVAERYSRISVGTGGINFRIQKIIGGVQGIVSDSRTGKPIPAADVSFSGPEYRYCYTNDSGYFHVSLKDGTYYMSVYADRYYSYYESGIQIMNSMITKNVALTRSGSFSGTVKDEQGIPLSANVHAVDSTGYVTWSYGYTDRQGAYVVSGLPTARFTAVVEAPGYIRQWYDKVSVLDSATYFQITDGFDTPNIDFVLSRGGSISGRVVDKHGVGISGVWIDVFDSSFSTASYAPTNDSGYYTASGLPSGTYYVKASHNEYVEQWYKGASTPDSATKVSVTVHQNTADINFVLIAGAAISGIVTAKDIVGNLYADVIVTDSTFIPVRFGYTTGAGEYSITNLDPGKKYYVCASKYGYSKQWYDNVSTPDSATPIILLPEEKRENIDFALRRSGAISGQVHTVTGYPAFIDVCDTMGYFLYSGYQDAAAGGYTVNGVPSGVYRVRAFSFGNGYTEQWYDHKHSLQQADNVRVIDETITKNIDFDLAPVSNDSAVTVFLEMVDLQDSLIFSAVHVDVYNIDYWWGIRFDSDNNPATGLNGYDVEIAAMHWKMPGDQEFKSTLVDGTSHIIMQWVGDTGYYRHGDVAIRLDNTNKKKLILTAPKKWTEMTTITPGTKFYAHAAHRSSSGWYEDMTALDTTTPSVMDSTGEVPYSFIDIVSAGWNVVTDVEEQDGANPHSFVLHQNYPNPFNPATTIQFQIPHNSPLQGGHGGFVTLKIYDLLGREVATLVNEEMKAGWHSVKFNASRFSTGVYIYTLRAGNFVASKKLQIIK